MFIMKSVILLKTSITWHVLIENCSTMKLLLKTVVPINTLTGHLKRCTKWQDKSSDIKFQRKASYDWFDKISFIYHHSTIQLLTEGSNLRRIKNKFFFSFEVFKTVLFLKCSCLSDIIFITKPTMDFPRKSQYNELFDLR